MSNVLLGPGATGIVGAAGGAMHAAKDMVAANAAAICGWKRFMVLPPDGKLSLRRVLLCRQVLKDLNAKAARAWPISGTAHRRTPALELATARCRHAAIPEMAWWMAICGVGFGFFQSPNNRTILASAPPDRAGSASGILATARLVGQTFGAALVGPDPS
jgi:hypothetical protein